MKKGMCLVLTFVLVILSVSVSHADMTSGPVDYSASNVSHYFNTGSKTIGSYRHAFDTPATIVYINVNDSTDTHQSYHLVKFIDNEGNALGGSSYHVSTLEDGYDIGFSNPTGTSAYARIKNRYYGTSESYYKMTTTGAFNLTFS